MAEKDKLQVFISYSRRNKIFVRKLNTALDEAGVEAWVDWEGIPFSADWMETITAAIEASDAFVFVISPEALKSAYCLEELELAIKGNKKIIPVVYKEPEKGSEVHPKLASTNWIFLRPRKDKLVTVLPQLLETIFTDQDWIHQHTRLQRRATEWKQKNYNGSYLLFGSDLEEAEQWMAASTEEENRQLTPLQAEYIRASRKSAVTRQRRLTLGIGFLFLISIILGIFALYQWNEAEEKSLAAEQALELAKSSEEFALVKQSEAEESMKLAEDSENAAKGQRSAAQAKAYGARFGELDTSTLLALESLHRYPSGEAEDVLRDNLSKMPIPIAQLSHTDRITNLTLSRDGQYFVSSSTDDTACVWKIDGGQVYCVQHEDDVTDALITDDNSLLITASADNTVRLWDFQTGAPQDVFEYAAGILDIDLNPQNDTLIAGREDGVVSVISLGVRRTVYDFNFDNGAVRIVKFHPNGEWMSLGTDEGRVRLWKVKTGLLESGPRHAAPVTGVAISPDGKVMISTSEDSTARISRAETGRETHVLNHPDWVEDVSFAPDGSWFVTAADDKIVRVFDTATGVEKNRMYHGSFVLQVAVSPSGYWIASTGNDHTMRIWDARSGTLMLEASLDGIGSSLLFGADDNWIAVGDQSGNLTLWDISSLNTRIGHMEFPEYVNQTRFDPAGNWILVNANDRNIWKIPANQISSLHDGTLGILILSSELPASQMEVSPNSRWVALSINGGTESSQAILSNLETETQFSLEHSSAVSSLSISPDSKYLATTNQDNKVVSIWDVEAGNKFTEVQFEESVFTAAYSPVNSILAIGLTDKTILWDTAANQQMALLNQIGRIQSVRFDAKGAWLATANTDGSLFIWDMSAGDFSAPKYRFLQDGRIAAIDFNPQRQWLAFAGTQGKVFIHDLDDGLEIARIPHADAVSEINFSPDGNLLATASRKIVQFWDLDHLTLITGDELTEIACSRLTRNFTQSEWRFFFAEDEYQILCPGLE